MQLTPKSETLMSDYKTRLERDLARSKKAEIISTAQIPAEIRPANSALIDDSFSNPVTGISFAAVAAVQETEDLKFLEGENSDVCFIFSVF